MNSLINMKICLSKDATLEFIIDSNIFKSALNREMNVVRIVKIHCVYFLST